ncbi:hypothetical protein [Actinomadura xylanilytica]|uniref:hypothetical protein n=1 Tax=Actinomadura xylanilytica TaxID=887459 RepID=UPI00255A87A6|nr:hypothetical protein [Actinomadura xylanilytica]MDL4776354.1 hypothetical protein [Actinomadura xylanilytica]
MTGYSPRCPKRRPIDPRDLWNRLDAIAGLRALADLLEARPTIPVRDFDWEYRVFSTRRADDATSRAAIAHLGALLGETPVDETANGGHVIVTRTFGPISYEGVYVPAQKPDGPAPVSEGECDPLPPVARFWTCVTCGGGGVASDGSTCPDCEGFGH